jgi:hypothetical protein
VGQGRVGRLVQLTGQRGEQISAVAAGVDGDQADNEQRDGQTHRHEDETEPVSGAAALKDDRDPGGELGRTERLHHTIIGAHVEALLDIGPLAARGHQDHRDTRQIGDGMRGTTGVEAAGPTAGTRADREARDTQQSPASRPHIPG